MSVHIENSSSSLVVVDDGGSIEGVFEGLVKAVLQQLEDMKAAEDRRRAEGSLGYGRREQRGTTRWRSTITVEYSADE